MLSYNDDVHEQNRDQASMSFTHRISQLGSLSENAVGSSARTFLVSGTADIKPM